MTINSNLLQLRGYTVAILSHIPIVMFWYKLFVRYTVCCLFRDLQTTRFPDKSTRCQTVLASFFDRILCEKAKTLNPFSDLEECATPRLYGHRRIAATFYPSQFF